MIAVYPGSFDLFTFGHMDILRRASKLFDTLIVGVLINSNKTPLFTLDERVGLIQELITDLPNVSVKAFDGLLVDFVAKNNARCIIRGIRSCVISEHDFQMTLANHIYASDIETFFMFANPEFIHISSSLMKQIILAGGSLDGMVPTNIIAALDKKFKAQN